MKNKEKKKNKEKDVDGEGEKVEEEDEGEKRIIIKKKYMTRPPVIMMVKTLWIPFFSLLFGSFFYADVSLNNLYATES